MAAWKVLIAHAEGEDELAEKLAKPLSDAGYEVVYYGTILVGESIIEEASKVLGLGGPVILCATVAAIGTGLPNRFINAARLEVKKRVFIVQMEKNAYIDAVAFGDKFARYWQDSAKAIDELLAALNRYFPLDKEKEEIKRSDEAEQKYRDLLLATCDIINLSNLPQDRNTAQQPLALRQLYVPLRVRIEAEAGDKAEWEELEKRRLALMKGNIDFEKFIHRSENVAVGERLAKSKRLVILGDPGSGKTTLTRWISTAFLLRHNRDPAWKNLPDINTLPNVDLLPIIIRCRDLNRTCLDGSLCDILQHTLRKAELSSVEAEALQIVFQKRLNEGTALLIIDGLDEIPDPSIRSRFCQQLENIHLAYPNAMIIATSRIVGYKEMGYRLGRGFEHAVLVDFTPNEKDNFAAHWCELTELPENKEKATRELIQDIHSSDRIERMTGNPMLLTTMALVRRKVGKLPNRRADLYWEAIQVLLNWRSDVDRPLDTNEAIPQLEYAAYDMCDLGVQQIRQDVILESIAKMRDEYPNLHQTRNSTPQEFLDRLEARTGLIVEAGHIHDLGRDVPVYEFRHLTFQEYLAARALVDGCFPGRDSEKSLADNVAPLAGRTSEESLILEGVKEVSVVENWREALRLCTSICRNDDVDSTLHAILTSLSGEHAGISRARSILAMLCISDEPNVSEATVLNIFQAFVSHVRKGDGGGKIITGADIAANEVGKTRWASYLSSILAREFIRRKDRGRYEIGSLSGLVQLSNAQINRVSMEDRLAQLTDQILNGKNYEVIEAGLAVMRVAYDKSDHITSSLIDALLYGIGENEPKSHALAWAFAWATSAADKFVDFFSNRTRGPPWQKPSWISWDYQTGWAPTNRDVQHILSIISDPKTSKEILLFMFWTAERHRLFFRERAVDPLILRLDDPDSSVRKAAASAFGSIMSERAVDPLILRLDDPDAGVREAAASALGDMMSERAVDPLILRLDDPDAGVRWAAASALGDMMSERAVDPLILRLDDPDAGVRWAAASALGDMMSERAVDPLILRLDDPDAGVREAAALALCSTESGRAVDPLILRLDDPEASVRRNAVLALDSMKSERAVDPLILRLDDPDENVREAAASCLGDIMSERAVDPLILRLDDPDSSVRRAAASALGSMKSGRAVDPLILRLDDPEASVRKAATSALGSMKSERAVELLILRLDDPEASVRKAATSALGFMKSERAVELLILRLDDPDSSVRKAAVSALGDMMSERAVDPLILRLYDPDENAREAAASALGSMKSERAVELLILRLDDPEASVRKAATSALGFMKNERAVELLILRLDDPDSSVRWAAASALGSIMSERAVDPLILRLDDPDSSVRWAAASALGSIMSERAVDPLILRLDDPDSSVRWAAASALSNIRD